MNLYFGLLPLNSHCSRILRNIFEGPWSPSFRELVAFHEQIDGKKSDLGF